MRETGNGAVTAPRPVEPAGEEEQRSYARGARILSIGVVSTGLFTFAYLAAASHALNQAAYGRITLCFAVMFVIMSAIYRPIEQMLSRTIADRRARGLHSHPMRVPALIQFSFACLFLVLALVFRDRIQNGLFDGSAFLYWVMVIGVLAYAASFFARGWLAGHERFALYGGLIFLESTSRFFFAFIVAIGLAHGQDAVALGMVAAPFASLLVVPLAFTRAQRQGTLVRRRSLETIPVADAAREGPAHAEIEEAMQDLSMKRGTTFAVSVFGIMTSEQALMNAAVLIVSAQAGHILAGFVFNILLIVRAPLQLFQAIQTSILPHLAGLAARNGWEEFGKAIRKTILAIAAFAGAVAVGLLLIGPQVMTLVLGDKGFHYARGGLALVALGMGLHLASGTLNQAALARERAPLAAVAWLCAAGTFIAFVASHTVADIVLRVEVGYFGAAALLCTLLYALYKRPVSDPPPGVSGLSA